MTGQGSGPPDAREPVRYRWVTDRRGPLFLPGALIGRFVVQPIIGRRGITVASDGVTVHKIFGSRPIPWSEIKEVTTVKSVNQGDQIVLALTSDEKVKLPAPTSKTTGNVAQARALIEAWRADT